MSENTETTTQHTDLEARMAASAQEVYLATQMAGHLRAGRFTTGTPEIDAALITLLEIDDAVANKAAFVIAKLIAKITPKGKIHSDRLLGSSTTDSSETEIEIEVSSNEVVLEVVAAEKSDSDQRAYDMLTWEEKDALNAFNEGIRQQAEARQSKIDEINGILSQKGSGDYVKWFRSQMDKQQNSRIQVFLKNIEILKDGPLDRLLKDLRIFDGQLQAEREAKKVAREAEAAARREAKPEAVTESDSVDQTETPPVADLPLPEKTMPKRRRLSAKQARSASKGK